MKKHPSPLKAIRLHCLWCCCDQPQEVRLCGAVDCSSYPLRFGKSVEGLRPLTVIKEHCLGCSGDEHPKDCDVTDCALYPFRLGKNPNRAGLSGRGTDNFKQPRQGQKSPAQDAIQEGTPAATGLCSCSTVCAECSCLAEGAK
jgi:hypothetical protein